MRAQGWKEREDAVTWAVMGMPKDQWDWGFGKSQICGKVALLGDDMGHHAMVTLGWRSPGLYQCLGHHCTELHV